MKKTILILVMLAVLCTMSMTANAATTAGIIDLSLEITSPTEFSVFATMAPGDGYGIAILGFFVTGFDTLENMAPTASAVVYTSNTKKSRLYTGFSDDFSDYDTGEFAVSFAAEPDLLATGLGQTAGDLTTLFPNWANSYSGTPYTRNGTLEETQSVYDAKLLVLRGTYSSAGGDVLGGDAVLPMLGGDLNGSYLTSPLLAEGSPVLAGATVVLHNPTTPAVPEPSSMIALGSGVLGLFGLIRRKRS